jgi:hypothetical protein
MGWGAGAGFLAFAIARPERRQNPLSAPTIFLAWRAPAHRKLAPARDGFFDEPGLGVVLREELGLVCARGPHLRNRYDAKGGSNAVVLKLRLPNREISGQDGKLDYVSPIGGGAIRPLEFSYSPTASC